MGSIGLSEIAIILALAAILFGGRKLPEIGKGLGKAIREFRRADEDVREAMKIDPPRAGGPPAGPDKLNDAADRTPDDPPDRGSSGDAG